MTKEAEYEQAMGTYHRSVFYRNLGYVVSTLVVALQAVALFQLGWSSMTPAYLLVFVAAYVLTDFVNGFIHMIMDNNDDYTSVIGPLVAIFHRHHNHPRYTDHHPLVVYFFENGMKNWLVPYMGLVVAFQAHLPAMLSFGLVSFGILSSVAEVSHYLCHNSIHPFVKLLQRSRILLDPVHHQAHHDEDNVRYAFLNGVSDPLLDAIARRMYTGYVGTTDVHSRDYYG